jgi:hypothetical protein
VSAACSCSRCSIIRDRLNPEIWLDNDLTLLRRNNPSPSSPSDQATFLNHLHDSHAQLPRFRFLDTVILDDGEPLYAIYFQDGKAKTCDFPGNSKTERQLSVRAWLI